jgi:hypothetical protein
MPNPRVITWWSDDAKPTADGAGMQVDYNDNTQVILTADSDVTSEPAVVQSVHAALFQSGE